MRPQGTFWQSKHHYGTAYHALFGSLRESVTSLLEIGIGEDTSPSVATWASYFPRAHIYPVDIKTKREVADRAQPGGATDRVAKHQAKFGCEYNRSMWSNPRIHLTLETDASDPAQLSRVPLPPLLDIIIDDGSHRYLDQQAALHTLWPRLRPGGFYVVEDMLVGALPWDKSHERQVCASAARLASRAPHAPAPSPAPPAPLARRRSPRRTPSAASSASSRSASPSTLSCSTVSATSRGSSR